MQKPEEIAARLSLSAFFRFFHWLCNLSSEIRMQSGRLRRGSMLWSFWVEKIRATELSFAAAFFPRL
jgi:hypothetical protein